MSPIACRATATAYLPTGGTGGGFGGNGSGGGTGDGGLGFGGDGGLSGIVIPWKESFLLQPFAVDLINSNGAPNEIPIFLIRETASARRPSQLARRSGMIRFVNQIMFNSIILRDRFSLVNQNCVIDAETRISCEETGE
jgi:hypothetical protein